jgi:hypothetical protein
MKADDDNNLFPELQPDPGMAEALAVVAARAELSPDRRRTLRQKDEVANGRHPLGLAPLAGNGRTCGDCVHRVLVDGGNRAWPKCDAGARTHGGATDCRAWWPACTRYEAKQ